MLSADSLTPYGQLATLIILEARTPSQLFFENQDFLLEIFNDELLVVIHPAGNAHQEEG
jgi:hypothetical protein